MLFSKRKDRKSIFLIGGFGVPNWGDELILERLLLSPLITQSDINHAYVATANASLSAQLMIGHNITPVDAHFGVLKIFPEDLAEFDTEKIKTLAQQVATDRKLQKSDIRLASLCKAISESTAAHFCGGGYIFDAWKPSLIAMAFVTFLSKALGKSVTASGISPVARTSEGFDLLTAMIAELDVLDVRDCIDPRFFNTRKEQRPDTTFLSCDDAVAFCPTGVKDYRQDKCRVHIQFPEIPLSIKNPRDDFCVEFLTKLAAQRPMECFIINHVGPQQKDWDINQQLVDRLIAAGLDIYFEDLRNSTPQEGMEVLRKANLAIVGRYHAMIGHLLCGVPVLTFDTGSPIFTRHRSCFPLVTPELIHVSDCNDIEASLDYTNNVVSAKRTAPGFSGQSYEKANKEKELAYNCIKQAWG